MNGWAKIKSASRYAGISERTMRDWLKAGLRHCRLPTGTVLIRYIWIDEYLKRFEVKEGNLAENIDRTVAQLCQDLQ